MIKVDEALRSILEEVGPLGCEEIPILEGLNRVLAEDISARANIPPFDNSAMDGYAVSSRDIAAAHKQNPVILDVLEDLPAGGVFAGRIRAGQAVKIMTGAPIPEGADSVIVVEKTEPLGKRVKIFARTKPGENIRRAGEDIKKGELVLKKGALIRPAEMGVLASLGLKAVKVSRRPKVGILATGDELVEIEEDIAPGKIRNSNSYTLFAQVREAGGRPYILGIARDNQEDIRSKIEEGLNYDLLLISGGVSVGDYDYIKKVLQEMGARMKFWGVAIRPGKPLVFSVVRGRPVFGLPGNPVSGMVCFEVFVRPAILKMIGQATDRRRQVRAVLEEEISKRRDFRYFLRAKTRWQDGRFFTHTTGPQGSGILKSMALANSLMILPEEKELIKKGTEVTVRFLGND